MVLSVAFNPNGNIIASGSMDKKVRLWDATTGNHLITLNDHKTMVEVVTFSTDGDTLVSSSGNGTIRLWDTATGTVKSTFNEDTDQTFSIAFSVDGNTLATGSVGGEIHLWDIATEKLKKNAQRTYWKCYKCSVQPEWKSPRKWCHGWDNSSIRASLGRTIELLFSCRF